MDTWHNKPLSHAVANANQLLVECYSNRSLRKQVLSSKNDTAISDPRIIEMMKDLQKVGHYLQVASGHDYQKTPSFNEYQYLQMPNSVDLKSLFSICALVGAMCRQDLTSDYISPARIVYQQLWAHILENVHRNAASVHRNYRGEVQLISGGFFVHKDPAIFFDGDIDSILELISNAGFLSFFTFGQNIRLGDVSYLKLLTKEEYTRRFLVDVLTVSRKPTYYKGTAWQLQRNYDRNATDLICIADAQKVYNETIKRRKFLPSLLHVISDLGFLLDSFRPFTMEIFAAETSDGGSFSHVAKEIRSQEDRSLTDRIIREQRGAQWAAAERAVEYFQNFLIWKKAAICRRALAIIGGYSPELWFKEVG